MLTWIRRSRLGQTMLEFAMIAPLFFMLLLGILDFGRAGLYFVAVSDLAREGARDAAVYDNGTGLADASVVSAVSTQANGETISSLTQPGTCGGSPVGTMTPPSPLTACYKPAVNTAYIFIDRSGITYVKVTVIYAFKSITPVIDQMVGTVYEEATSQMQTEY